MTVGQPGVAMRLASVATDGSDYREVPGIEAPLIYYSTWSRNGARIAFCTYDAKRPAGRQYTVWFCRGDGTGLTEVDEGFEPSWNADGTQLAYLFSVVTESPSTTWTGLAARNVVTGQGVFGQSSRTTGAVYVGAPAPILYLGNPRWAGNNMVWANFTSLGPNSPTVYALKQYLGFPGTVAHARSLSENPSEDELTTFTLNDFSPSGDVGLVREGLGTSSWSRVSWLSPSGERRVLKSRTQSGGGKFSPDGQRLWINLDDGRGARFVTRDLQDAGAPGPLPNSYGGYSWFAVA